MKVINTAKLKELNKVFPYALDIYHLSEGLLDSLDPEGLHSVIVISDLSPIYVCVVWMKLKKRTDPVTAELSIGKSHYEELK
jgi:hypothetical protein